MDDKRVCNSHQLIRLSESQILRRLVTRFFAASEVGAHLFFMYLDLRRLKERHSTTCGLHNVLISLPRVAGNRSSVASSSEGDRAFFIIRICVAMKDFCTSSSLLKPLSVRRLRA